MRRPDMHLVYLLLTLRERLSGDDGERGDVPGWVMITVMTAALVIVLLTAAKGPLRDAFTNAVNNVTSNANGK